MFHLHAVPIVAVLLALAASTTHAGLVTLINPGTDDRVSTIENVTISGTSNDGVYDFTFHHGESPGNLSYNTLVTNLSPVSPITWTSDADAAVVILALESELLGTLATSTPATVTRNMVVPYATTAIHVQTHIGRYAPPEPATFYTSGLQGDFFQNVTKSGNAAFTEAYVTATVVPEPSSFLYGGLLVVSGLALAGLKRKLAGYRQQSC